MDRTGVGARRAVVTGGTRGLGFHVASQLHRQGFAVTVIGRDPAYGEEAARVIGPGARFQQADLSSLNEVRELGARLAAEGPLHLLINLLVDHARGTRRDAHL